MQEHIQEYIKQIKSIDVNNANEHTYRTALENLINALQFKAKHTTAIQEAKDDNLEIEGTPDFFIYEDYDQLFKSLIGFIECKKISRDLADVLQSEQVKKYSKTTSNIIITNYRDFILLQEGKTKATATLIDKDFSVNNNPNKEQDFINLLRDFYTYDYAFIKTKKTLVAALASQSFYYSVALREYILSPQNSNDAFYDKFKNLFKEFQKTISYDYQLEDFCDIYAQSLVYGLLLARLETEEKFDEKSFDFLDNIPEEYRLLYEFLETGFSKRNLPVQIKVALTNIAKNINLVDVGTINHEFLKEGKGKNGIAVYLYEDFLKEYDNLKGTEKRKEGGVYYTPKPVTQFIAKSIEEIIKTKFGKKDGYLDKNVKVLDFACGTGTFIDSVYELMINKHASPIEKQQTKQKIMSDIYGFELLFTPYIVAHTILTKYLKENGLNMTAKDRLPIYLTNTLDLAPKATSGLLPNLKQENENAHKVKQETDILAILGNPPYFNGKSQSISKEIDEFTKAYKQNLNERKINLDDLYIKFIRFAEWKINKAGYGVVGIITNNSFLDGVTHRQMRKHLMGTFDEIYILNLHGNTRKGETDKNIFDIMVGVSISIFVKYQAPLKDKKVYYYSTLDNGLMGREEKLSMLASKSLSSVEWQELNPRETDKCFFVNMDFKYLKLYNQFTKIPDVFAVFNSGIETQKDTFAIQYNENKLSALKTGIESLSEEEIAKKYNISNSRDWKILNAKDDLLNRYNPTKIEYRVLDFRYTSLSKKSGGFIAYPRYDVMQHFDNKDNLGLCLERINNSKFTNIFATKNICDCHTTGAKTYLAPIYLYSNDMGTESKTANFTEKFYKEYLNTLSFKPMPEDILNYIYAVLHCPLYRETYVEFLKTDFPAVPMTKDNAVFKKYAALGKQLVALHTMQDIPKDKEIREEFEGEITNFVIFKIEPPTKNEPNLTLTGTDGKKVIFNGVTPDIYAFKIGSYNPIEKWLKYRKADAVILSIEDLAHIKNMIIILKHTMLIMEQIKTLNAEYLKWI